MDYAQSLLYLGTLTNYEQFSDYNYNQAYSLGRVSSFLALLGSPHKVYPTVTIAGTKGKGSTAVMLGSILCAAGIKTGIFTSPHLVSIRERIKIGNKYISKKDFALVLSRIRKVIEKNDITGLTFFELITASAFLYFFQRKVEIAIMEIGLGGRLDAVNTARSFLSAITPISYDHMHLLGSSLAKIAAEKGAVIQKNSSVIIAPQKKEALDVIIRMAGRQQAGLSLLGKDIKICNIKTSLGKTCFDISSRRRYYKNLHTPLLGRHQAVNAGLAVSLAEEIDNILELKVKEEHIRKGLRLVKFYGRFQVFPGRPCIVLDGAQNGDSAKALNDTLDRIFCKKDICFVIGISSDKDHKAIARQLRLSSRQVIFTQADSARAMPAVELARKIGSFNKNHFLCYDIKDSVEFARHLAPENGVIVVTGSLFLVGSALNILGYKNV
jgi:dihydrofolate synthase / folylpolyglutamate synthase